jgi:hypothetical protein
MNFIVGMLYFTFKDEATAFAVLAGIISTFKLEGLYKYDVPLLRDYMYKTNRLLAIFLPKLHAHVYNEGINASYLCSSWFLTIFTYVMQSRDKPPIFLQEVFNKFMIDGFNVILKAVLFVLSYFEENMLKMNYGSIIHFLNALPKSEFYNNPEMVRQFLDKYSYFKLTKELMQKLNKEHEDILTMSDNYQLIPFKGQFKYILFEGKKAVGVKLPI